MKTRASFFLIFAVLAVLAGSLSAADAAKADPESREAREQRLAWFRQDKFGLFIHWGLYSIPAGYWKGQRSPGIGEWVQHRLKIPNAEYADLARWFNPVRFDADAWAQLAQDAGMKYVVITSKHHDGFALFRSAASPFNVVDATPFKRDVVAELAAACAKRGLRFGVYYSQSQDWHEPGGAGNNWDFPGNDTKEKSGAFDRYLQEKVEPQLRELLTNYGPICLIWFDTPQLMNGVSQAHRGKRLTDIVRSLQPATLIDGRLGTVGDYQSTGDNVIPPKASDAAFEVPATLNHTWGYRSDDHNWKSPGELIFKLVDIVSKGGNYLLNVGPTAEGVIPQPSQDNLREVGAWLRVNGEAVYGTGRSPFGEEFGEYATNLKDRAGQPVFLGFNDWRCTTKPGKLYFTLFKVERDGPLGVFTLPAFKNRISSVYALTDAGRTPLEVKTHADGRRFFHPERWVNDSMGTVYVVEYEGDQIER
ncbi:alpha-L-fucosidase [Oleiharenicola lentus]|uniref:alpha-L-fucosidase n=1 Tax=Oleiharenicola lentus TaxID=2508720 RepID=A0A4Q1C5U5_9BACT|nr:alpha-L-fucosidase [Oleiharenicola lentus]RXK53807.1 alpha-L-fucosidase [Oleiharenicola lentus]